MTMNIHMSKYSIYSKNLPPRHKFWPVSLCGQPFSRYNVVGKIGNVPNDLMLTWTLNSQKSVVTERYRSYIFLKCIGKHMQLIVKICVQFIPAASPTCT